VSRDKASRRRPIPIDSYPRYASSDPRPARSYLN